MTVSTAELRTATVSDIHLGHPRTETSLIAQNLKDAFPHNAETAMLDVIIFAGDVFDRLLTLPQDEVAIIDDVILYFLKLCARYDILFLVLEGTPSHDRNQSKRFVDINNQYKVGCDLHYVDDLEIRYFEKIDSHILFVPDEWGTADAAIAQAKMLMEQYGISQVDYAVMHGQFEHQLPEFIKAQKHSLAEYRAIVSKLIWIGHVHIFSQKENVIAQGSFDRLSHNEEMAKGHVRCKIRSSTDWEVQFVENKGAKIYKTIDCRGLELNESLAKVEETVSSLPDGSRVRVSAEVGNQILQSISHYEKKYSNLIWDMHEKIDKEKKIKIKKILSEETFVPVQITQINIEKIVGEKLETVPLSKGVTTDRSEIIDLAKLRLSELVTNMSWR